MGSLGSVLPLCMFMPALGALLVKADIKEMGWRLRSYKNWKYIVFAWLAPTVFQIIGAALYFMVFPEDFAPAEAFQRFMSDTEYEEFLRNGSHYAAYIADDISDSLNPLSALVPIILALGEEIGWRGFMYPELEESHGRTKGLLIGGAIHGAWHFPGMLLAGFEYGTDYIGAPVLGLVVFCFYTVAMGIISYHLYVKSGSIWLPAIFHAMINSESSPRMLLGNSHPERSVFGPVDIGLIAMLPMAACAAFLLWYQYKREQTEPENDLYADSFSE
ncbi:MAG: CPBP family intramembrane metalloprotease [Ruminococcus sp.]|nr:CPBP family intramembrane metalloprotease [Ruminococcus sp.]